MDIRILDDNFIGRHIVDIFESFIWTDRYDSCGDFEIYATATSDLIQKFASGSYIYSQKSQHLMIIESRELTTDVENGNHLIIKGRSLESILDRRIVWTPTKVTGNLQLAIKKLIDENIISATITDRRIPNFIFDMSTDPIVTALTVEAQFLGETLYDIISTLCNMNGIGFRIFLDSSNNLRFKLYSGVDRSFAQSVRPQVVFSPKFENLINSSSIDDYQGYKTNVLVRGSDGRRKSAAIGLSGLTGLSRREMFIDAGDLSRTVDEEEITVAEYELHLQQRGLQELSKNVPYSTFDGQADVGMILVYGIDFNMGDIVQFQNEYGMEARSRVTEMLYSESLSGIGFYPTFTHIEEE